MLENICIKFSYKKTMIQSDEWINYSYSFTGSLFFRCNSSHINSHQSYSPNAMTTLVPTAITYFVTRLSVPVNLTCCMHYLSLRMHVFDAQISLVCGVLWSSLLLITHSIILVWMLKMFLISAVSVMVCHMWQFEFKDRFI